jgi:APA family basic amino acid/polyamine antiporter
MSLPERPGSQLHLLRALDPATSAAIVLGTMIGTGIFLKPSEVAREAGSMIVVAAAWIGGGLLSMFGALCYAELGASLPEAGGEYAYLRRAFGAPWGFLFGWMHSIVARPASAAAITAGLLRFCGAFYPALHTPLFAIHFHLPRSVAGPTEIAFSAAQFVAVFVLVLVTTINYLGVRLGGRVQVGLTILKIAIILVIVLGGAWLIESHQRWQSLQPLWPSSAGRSTVAGFLTALAATAWAYDGWNDLNLVGSEVRHPERTFPIVIVRSMIFVMILFLFFNLVCFLALPFSAVASSQHVASDVFESFAGRSAALWITLAMILSALGTLNSSILSGARVDYAMARDGIFFKPIALVHPRFRTPSNALLFQCVLASLMALTGTFEDLTALVMFGSWTFYALAVLAMMRMRKTEPELPRPYRTWGYPLVPVLFVVGAFALAASLWASRPIRSSIGVLLILSGLIFYRRWSARLNSTLPDAAGVSN